MQTAQQTMSHLGNRFDVRRTLGWNEIARTDNNCWNCCGILLLDARGVHHCWWQLCAGVCTRHQRRHDGSWKWLLLQQAWCEGRHVRMRISQRSKNWRRRRRHLIPFLQGLIITAFGDAMAEPTGAVFRPGRARGGGWRLSPSW